MAAIPAEIFNLFIGLFAVIGIETLFLFFIVFKTPALTFLSASMLKKPIIYIMGKDKLGKFRTFKREHGAAQVKGEGVFSITENSHTLEVGSKIPLYFAFRDLAATLDPQYPAILQELKEKGLVITHCEDLEKFFFDIKKGMIKDLPVEVKPFKTYKLHEMENMFPFNIDPTFIDATVQYEIAKGLKLLKTGPMAMMGILLLLIVGGVTVFIVQKAFSGSITMDQCLNMYQGFKATTANAVSTVVSTYNSTPIVK